MDLNSDTIGKMLEYDSKLYIFMNHLRYNLNSKEIKTGGSERSSAEFSRQREFTGKQFKTNFFNEINHYLDNFDPKTLLINIMRLANELYKYLEGEYNSRCIEKIYLALINLFDKLGLDYRDDNSQ